MRLVVLSDLHSPYARLAGLVAAVRRAVQESPDPALILINGDVFERGNVVALRSDASLDWQALAALRAIAPVVLNLGNHEASIADDLGAVVRRMEAAGIRVTSNIIDQRSGRFLAPPLLEVCLGTARVAILALATDALETYRESVRHSIIVPDPVPFARSLVGQLRGPGRPILLSHAGLSVDRTLLDLVPDGTILVGGHEHLTLSHTAGRCRFLHVGAWAETFGVVDLEGENATVELRGVDPRQGVDPELTRSLEVLRQRHLRPADLSVVAEIGVPMPFDDAASHAVEWVRAAADADVAVLSHTTFGTGLDAGIATRFDFDAFIRFDDDVRTATVDGPTLERILGRANQHRVRSLEARTGDFVHAGRLNVTASATYRLATIGWVAERQSMYFGVSGLRFDVVPGLGFKAVVAAGLRRAGGKPIGFGDGSGRKR